MEKTIEKEFSQLRKEIRKELREEFSELKNLIKISGKTDFDNWLTSNEIMKLLDISRATFERMVKTFTQKRKVNNRIYVHKDEINKLLEDKN